MCAVNAVVCCVLLVHGRCVMYAGGSRSCPMRSRDAGGYAQCAALYAGGRGGVGRDALCANLYAGGCGGWALFAGGVGRAEGAGGDAPCAALYAGGTEGAGGDAMCAALYAESCGGWALFAGD